METYQISSPVPLLLGFSGTSLTKPLTRHLSEINPAGIVLFKRNITSLQQTRLLIDEIKDLLGDIIVTVDHEGGVVSRFPDGCANPPSPKSLRQTGSLELVREACKIQAEMLRYLGVNLNFVPVLDLLVNPDNQAIGTRSFSADAEEVATYGKICIEEHQKYNIGTTAKHFPGHGRTSTDSHFALGEVDYSDEEFLNQDLKPYKTAIETGVSAVMTAHLMYPVLDNKYPASLSEKILTGILRNQLKFQGLIIDDCVEMSGISDHYSPKQIVQYGVEAGVDLFISSFSLKKSLEYQLELKREYDSLIERCEGSFSRFQGIYSRLDHFIESHLKGDKVEEIAEIEETLKIHKKTLEKVKKGSIPKGFHGIYLIELANREYKGINADSRWNSVSKEIIENCSETLGRKLIFNCNNNDLKEVVYACNRNKNTCVLLTSNGFRHENYSDFIDILQVADSAVHIALLDDRDLTGQILNEWVTWGFNACTGKMLAEELMNIP